MNIVFTICSNNYLAQASVLGKSLKQFNENAVFFTILVDERSELVDYSKLSFECIPIKDIEPNIDELMEKYDIVELNTCVKPAIFQYFFTNYDDVQVVYLDPDIKIYNSLEDFDNLFKRYNILLTPHIFNVIPLDGKSPSENVFLNYGIYNLGFVAVKKSEESSRFIAWWKERTYTNGYNRVCEGVFVDQLYINLVPLLFKDVYVLFDKGYNMAPWNLHERVLIYKGNKYFVNGTDSLKFFHFSSFKINSGELPTHFYNRFTMSDRLDLSNIFSEYNTDLTEANYLFFKEIRCVYLDRYTKRRMDLKQQAELDAWNKKTH